MTVVYHYLKENRKPSITYGQLFNDILFAQDSSRKFILGLELPANLEKIKTSLNLESKNVNYSDLLLESKALDKPIILYFTGYGCVNARKIEQFVFSDKLINKKLQEQFIFVSLYVDDETGLPENEPIKDTSRGRKIRTIGQKNMELEVSKFKNNTQPLLAIIDAEGTVLGLIGYTLDKKTVLQFLNDGSSQYGR